MELAFDTGLRISDVLSLETKYLNGRMTVTERKTGKRRRIYVPRDLLARLRALSGSVYVFPGRCDPEHKHRTRQAVWRDVKRAARAMRITDTVGCHTARKVYAVDIYRAHGLTAAQNALGHDRPETTLIYLATELCK